jgi:hypothetical protein
VKDLVKVEDTDEYVNLDAHVLFCSLQMNARLLVVYSRVYEDSGRL